MASKYLAAWYKIIWRYDSRHQLNTFNKIKLEFSILQLLNLVIWTLLSCQLLLKSYTYFILDKLKFAKGQGCKRCCPTLMLLKHLLIYEYFNPK